jgi:hypothetical protein
MKISKADLVKYFRYLDELRELGATNMFGAGQYLEEAFELKKSDARTVLSHWMETFSDDTVEERVNEIEDLAS